MAIKDTITADEFKGLDEGFKGLYVEKEGGYHLDVEGREDVSGLKSALEKERAAAKTFKEQIKTWEALGASPEEISAALKAQAKKEPPKSDNPASEQHSQLLAEIAELRKTTAELAEERRAEKRQAHIERALSEYPEPQRMKLAKLVSGETPEEIAASIEELKKDFPAPQQKPAGAVGGPSNPPSKKEVDDAAAEYGKKRAQAQSKNTNQEAFKTI